MTSETIDLQDVEGQQLAERSKAAKRPRLLYIDNLRIVLITAVIFTMRLLSTVPRAYSPIEKVARMNLPSYSSPW